MKLEYFSISEFNIANRDWFTRMSPTWLAKIDLLRWWWGKPIAISPVKGALGRDGDGTSQHYWEQFDEVRAGDVLPSGIVTQSDARDFFELAEEAGFTGIGVYPDWAPSPGFHLDVREDCEMGSPATWGGVKNEHDKQVYVSFEEAVKKLPEN